MKCEACGKEGTLDIRATLIRCSFCDAEWGRVNGSWVESKPPRCMECGGDGRTVEAEPKTCPSCAGTGREGGVMGFPDEYVFPAPHDRYTRAFLSRGVCPPVARWLLAELERNLRGTGVGDVVRPGDVYDVRPARGWFASQ